MALPSLPKVGAGAAISADDVQRWEHQVTKTVTSIEDIARLEEWRSQAAALETYLRGKEMQRPMLGAQRRIEGRIGQLLNEPEKGGRGKTSEHDPRLRDYLPEFRLLARALGDECELTVDEWRKSRRALVSLIRQRLGLTPPLKPLPDGIFRCIVADPPWKQDTGPNAWGTTGESGHDSLTYEQMTVECIKEMSVVEHAADDAHLYLWTINRYVEQSYEVARAWGFKPSVLLVWAKTPHGVGLGDAYRITTEFILYARRGHLKENRIIETTWFNWPRGKHSEKPVEFYELVESMTPSSGLDRLEMFARQKRKGWIVWGDEVPDE